ncbi:hypothetical protein Bca52824_016682 [Brassica carinata]|uniref:Uncharacterized protein n=1 Tax=Brassica carinata TaxID=52824 RepID=A0A8X8B4A9_BRACI|nr:hypothetical protein Bca52824_016682 [Brassica carinata]
MANLCIQRLYQTIPFMLLNSLRKLLLNITVVIFLTPPQAGDDNPDHDMPGAGAVTTDPSQSVERGIYDNSNRPSNHVMMESLPGGVTELNDIPVSSDMSSAGVPQGRGCTLCEEATPWLSFKLLESNSR